VAVLEGATPYLRPSIRDPIVRQLLQAHSFFAHPSRNGAFLIRERVDYVVLLTGGVGTRGPVGIVHPEALARAPFLTLVHASRPMSIYRVDGLSQASGRPPGAPGYDCLRSSISL
jgi:hypothetical protein